MLAAVACCSAAAFVACDKDDDKGSGSGSTNVYTITIQYEDGSAFANKQMGICDYVTDFCTSPKTTDENGTVIFDKLDKGTYSINSNFIPSGYELQEEYQFTDYGEYTVVLVEKE